MEYKGKELKVINFNFPEMKVLRKNSSFKTKQNNVDSYVNWVLDILRSFHGKELEKGEQFNACCLYTNKKNVDLLHKYLEPMTWLNYSPTECNELKDDELGIDVSEITQKRI